ncbi:MAG: hypothetical protein KBF17_10275 [Candidatus Promineofilum sp.]|nr:hypothetical protein [Promineifilum sp.]
MMRRLALIILSGMTMLVAAMPVAAQGENPLDHAVLLAGTVGWIMIGLALLLMVFFVLWTRRGPG